MASGGRYPNQPTRPKRCLTVDMDIGIVTNTDRDPRLTYTKEISEWLINHGHTPVLEGDGVYSSKFLIVLGGDGTMLQAAHKAAKHSTPMLGINLGNLGYLTDVDRHDGINAIEKMLNGDFRREQRMMLTVRDYFALNEVAIRRDGSFKLMEFRICAGGFYMDTFRADGVIVSTPTGSTAYNLSAGGPILRPDSEMIVITAVCPHTLYTRPWVLSGNDSVSLVPLDVHGGRAAVSIDGEVKFFLEPGEEITVTRSDYSAIVVKTENTDFFEVLRKKIK